MRTSRTTTLSAVLTASPTWEALYQSAQYQIRGAQEKIRTDPLPTQPTPRRPRTDRTDCRYLEAVPFKAHCYCNRLTFGVIVHEGDCKNCKKYFPKPKSTNQ